MEWIGLRIFGCCSQYFSDKMDKEFYFRRIQQLTDDKLRELLQLRKKNNTQIISMAETEALKRGIDIATIESQPKSQTDTKSNKDKEFSWIEFIGHFIPEP